jgi:hypothetical protein
MAKNKKKFDVGSADPKPSKTSILSNGQAYDREALPCSTRPDGLFFLFLIQDRLRHLNSGWVKLCEARSALAQLLPDWQQHRWKLLVSYLVAPTWPMISQGKDETTIHTYISIEKKYFF